MNGSTGTIPNHDDAASALMALAGTADANSSDGSNEQNPPNPPPPPDESAASSPKLAAAAISANRFPEKVCHLQHDWVKDLHHLLKADKFNVMCV